MSEAHGKTLSTNGMVAPEAFPIVQYEAIYEKTLAQHGSHQCYDHFSGSWNALAYRFRASIDQDRQFADSLDAYGAEPVSMADAFLIGRKVWQKTEYWGRTAVFCEYWGRTAVF